MEEDSWDLHAVVRGCCSAAAMSPTTSGAIASSTVDLILDVGVLLPPLGSLDLLEPRRTSSSSFEEELHDLCKPFFPKPEPPLPLVFHSAAVSGGFSGSKDPFMVNHPPIQQKPFSSAPTTTSATNCRTSAQAPPRSSKRKKNQFKKVCQVPAESVVSSDDVWSWRKYGQKPIKGSPYPRGYYRCSSSKGCLAKKQVERNRSDPGIFIVTYTAEHNHPAPTHRNSLAGSTRHKSRITPPIPEAGSSPSEKLKAPPSSSSPATSFEEAVPQSTSRGEHDDNMDDEKDDVDMTLSDMALSDIALLNDDDFFVGLDIGLFNGGCGSYEDCFLERFPASFGLSWNKSTTAAATGSS